MARPVIIQQIGVDTDGSLQIGYYQQTHDLKANGVMHMHTIVIPAGVDYDDEIRDIMEAAERAVLDVLEDLPNLAPLGH